MSTHGHNSNEIARQFIKANNLEGLSDNLASMNDLSFDIAFALITDDFAWNVAMYIGSFSDEDQQKIANELIRSHNVCALLANFEDFESIDRIATLRDLIHSGAGTEMLLAFNLLGNLDHFDRLSLAQALVESGDLDTLQRFKFLLDDQKVTFIDYGVRGRVNLSAHILDELEIDAESTPPTAKTSTALVLNVDGLLVTESTPQETIEAVRKLAANGFDQWKKMTRIQRQSHQSDFETALSQIESLGAISI